MPVPALPDFSLRPDPLWLFLVSENPLWRIHIHSSPRDCCRPPAHETVSVRDQREGGWCGGLCRKASLSLLESLSAFWPLTLRVCRSFGSSSTLMCFRYSVKPQAWTQFDCSFLYQSTSRESTSQMWEVKACPPSPLYPHAKAGARTTREGEQLWVLWKWLLAFMLPIQ